MFLVRTEVVNSMFYEVDIFFDFAPGIYIKGVRLVFNNCFLRYTIGFTLMSCAPLYIQAHVLIIFSILPLIYTAGLVVGVRKMFIIPCFAQTMSSVLSLF